MDKRFLLILSGFVLFALTIITSAFLLTQTLKQIKFGRGTVNVKGYAEKDIQSDFIKWQATLSATASTQTQAYEKLEKDLDVLQQYLQKQGITLSEIVFSPIHSAVTYQRNDQGNMTNKIESYELSQTFSLASTHIDLITQVSQKITSLLREGLSVVSQQPQYFYLKMDELKIHMLGEAAKDAQQRAEALVSKNGSRVGVLRYAQQGVFQITPVFSSSISDYGEYDTTSIAKKIKAVVTMEYVIDG